MTRSLPPAPGRDEVLRWRDVDGAALAALLGRFGLMIDPVAPGAAIPGCYWGEPEAGLVESCLHYRADTPVHSILHEACHYVCMSPRRRAGLDTDAGGDDLEECAVCYLQIVLAASLPDVGRARMLLDMDRWGYTFRLGSAGTWFREDAGDAYAWLRSARLVQRDGTPTWALASYRSSGVGPP